MKSVKLVFFSLVAIFILLVVYQNRAVFTHTESFVVNLLVWKYESPPIVLSMYFVTFFLLGILIAYFHGLSHRFKAKHEMKCQLDRVTKLESEIEVLKSLSPQQATPPSEETQNA
jgi:uncharacterized integral membrane protein